MDFNTLCSYLAASNSGGPATQPNLGVDRVRGLDDPFVEPPIVVTDGNQSSAQAVIVVAPAAAGKSTLAARLAESTGGVLFDLAQWNVGNNFLPGTLFRCFGNQMSKIMNDLTLGADCIIFDALEETQMRSGEANFEAFLTDLAVTCQSVPHGRPSIIMMARAETAEFASLVLNYCGVDILEIGIDTFARSQACEYIDAHLDHQESNGQHRTQRGPFEDVRDQLFDLVGQTVRLDGQQEDEFLGYAPVLSALAEYLNVDNFMVLKNSIVRPDESQTNAAWHLVSQILHDIMAREQTKFHSALAERTGLALDDLTETFSLLEQAERVFRDVNRLSQTDLEVPDAVPAAHSADYIETVTLAVRQHAFVRSASQYANPVFRDYVEALLLAKARETVAAHVRTILFENSRLPSGLFGRFLLRQTDRVSASDVGLIYDSFIAAEAQAGSCQISVYPLDGGDDVGVRLSFDTDDPAVEFTADAGSSALVFQRSLRDAAIETVGELILGSAGGDFVLGPNVDIDSEFLTFESVSVRAVLSDEPIVIHAKEANLPGATMTVRTVGDGLIAIDWPTPSYPWVEHFSQEDTPGPDDETLHEVLKHLSHIFKYFVKHKREHLESPKLLMQNVGVGRSDDARALFDWLRDEEVITDSGDYFYVSISELTSRGINYTDLRSRRLTDDLRTLLNGFLQRSGG